MSEIRQRHHNKLTILTEQLHGSELACLLVWSRLGRFSESVQSLGTAELLEREFLRRHFDWTLARGGCVGVHTADDHLHHYLLLPNRFLADGLARILDAYAQSPLSEEEFLAAKRDLHAQMLLSLRQKELPLPQLIFGRHFTAFPGNGFVDRIAGIEALTYPAYLDFRARVLDPSQLMVTAVGSQSAEQMRNKLEEQAANCLTLTSDASTIVSASPIALPTHACQHARSAIGVGFALPASNLTDALPLALFTNALDMRQERLLNAHLYSDNRFAYWMLLTRDMEQMPFFPHEEIAREAAQILDATEIPPSALMRAKNMVEKHFLEESEGALGRACTLTHLASRQPGLSPAEYLERVRECRAEEIVAAFSKLQAGHPEYIVAAGEAAEASQLLQNFVGRFERARVRDTVEEDGDEGPGLWHSLPHSPLEPLSTSNAAVVEPHDPQFVHLEEHAGPFANGVRVISVHDRRFQLDYFGLYLRGGRIYENQNNCGITQLLFSSLLASQGSRLDQRQSITRLCSLNRALEWMGGYLEADVTADLSGVRGCIVPRYLPRALDELCRSFFFPRLADGAVLQWVLNTLADRSEQRRGELFHRTVDLFYQTVFGQHPYGLPRFGNEQSRSALTVRDLYAWHEAWVQPGKAVLVLQTARSVASTRALLGSMKLPTQETFNNPPAEILSLNQYSQFGGAAEIQSREDRNSAFVVGFPVIYNRGYMTDPRIQYKIDILQHALNGANGLLMADDERRLFKRVKAFYVPLAKGGVFFVYVEYDGATPEVARQAVLQSLQQLLANGLTKAQSDKAKQYAAGSHLIAMQAPLHQIYELARCQLLYADPSLVHSYADAVYAVTAEEVHETARNIINLDKFTSVHVKSADEMA